MATRRYIAELIQMSLAGGVPSPDFQPSLDEINGQLDFAVAHAAKIQYNESAQMDTEFVSDAFYYNFKNLALTKEADTGYWKTTMPASPIGLPRGYDITSVHIQGTGGYSKALVRLTPQQIAYYRELPVPKNRIFFFTQGAELFLVSDFDLGGESAMVRMAAPAGKRALTDQLMCPEDMIKFVIEYLEAKYLQKSGKPTDKSNDGQTVN
jgi:hypothetical protein